MDFCHWIDSEAVAEVNSRLFMPNDRLETVLRNRSRRSRASSFSLSVIRWTMKLPGARRAVIAPA